MVVALWIVSIFLLLVLAWAMTGWWGSEKIRARLVVQRDKWEREAKDNAADLAEARAHAADQFKIADDYRTRMQAEAARADTAEAVLADKRAAIRQLYENHAK